MEDPIEPAVAGTPEPGAGQPEDTRAAGPAGDLSGSCPVSTIREEQAAGPDEMLWPAGPEVEAFTRRVAAARDRVSDFDAVALNPDLPVSAAMAATIACCERGPEIAYHLGRNPELAARIARLDPLSAARELGRVEADLTATPRRSVTSAPPPLRPLGAGETPRRDPDAMTYREYRAWRRTG